MEIRAFGKSGIEVSTLGFGAGHIGGHNFTDAEVSNLLNSVVDIGINLFDTARAYGLSEERIGKHLSHRRNEIIISTKCGYGISGVNEALEFAATTGKFGSLEFSINPFDQRSIDKVLPITKENSIGVIAKRPIANVPWKFDEQPYGDYCEEYWKRMKKMNLKLDLDWLEAAIRFSAFTEGVSSIIIGTSSIDHLKKNLKLLEKGKLPKEIYSMIRKSFKENDDNWIGQV